MRLNKSSDVCWIELERMLLLCVGGHVERKAALGGRRRVIAPSDRLQGVHLHVAQVELEEAIRCRSRSGVVVSVVVVVREEGSVDAVQSVCGRRLLDNVCRGGRELGVDGRVVEAERAHELGILLVHFAEQQLSFADTRTTL